MTVGKKLHQTLTSLESAKASYEQFAQDTDDKLAQQMFQNGAQQLESLITDLRNRVNYIEQEEPQYKVEQQMMSGQQQKQQ
ncbi:hypothetical protein BBF96_12525 [Anoxybacter fermentans]|uniref:DUF1657 domain-containing protein n=1 Tax=Anoxybacter fermentans TaxID=1323375 RepID=A0A3S9T0S7_9FIRM|nr:DUF1657 domain-containing protein [Anoxybacter fermentans]AZR74149.1 hypothetical protein BBF96_12525 [Anoxybacter fermentans]